MSGSTSVEPTPEEGRLLADVFQFHELAVEDALAEIHHPKVETYGDFLYLILHGIDFKATRARLRDAATSTSSSATNFLVTVHDGHLAVDRAASASICTRNSRVLGEGPGGAAAPDRRRDGRQLPAGGREAARSGSTSSKKQVFERVAAEPAPRASSSSSATSPRCGASSLPQRDVVGRLARREFREITEALAYRFRDVYDHLVRLTDEAMFLQDRVTGLLDAHLSTVSNRLNRS